MTEKLVKTATYVDQKGFENPIEQYVNPEGYDEYKCAAHNRPATHKITFLNPKVEVEFPYGSRYFCDQCEVPDADVIAASDDAYFDVFYGPLEPTTQTKVNG